VVAKAGQTSQKSETRDQNSEVTDQELGEIAGADEESKNSGY
jgi:hypothetical protein